MPDISSLFSVIIPNWNGLTFLQPCLDALLAQSHQPLEIIIVDNASTDGSQAFIREHYPQVMLIALERNRGFTGACNAGIEAASGAFIALLNNDTEVDEDWAAAVVRAFDAHPDAGMVASKMLLYDRRDHLHTAGDGFTRDGRPYNRGVWQEDTGQFDEVEYVFSACGGSSVYRRELIDAVGMLDDDFFFLMEDVDLAWRAQLAGWRALYTPDAIVYHHLSATGGGVTASYYDGRNGIYLLVKDVPSDMWRRYGGRIIVRQLKIAWEALRSWRGEAARARLRGMLAGLLHIPKMLRKRRHVQRKRVVSADYIESLLSDPPEN